MRTGQAIILVISGVRSKAIVAEIVGTGKSEYKILDVFPEGHTPGTDPMKQVPHLRDVTAQGQTHWMLPDEAKALDDAAAAAAVAAKTAAEAKRASASTPAGRGDKA